MITEQAFQEAAKRLGCEVAAVKAVDSVESLGDGMLPDGKPKILFEPHVFWRELKDVGIKPVVSDICYPNWGTRPYGKVSAQHGRLERAAAIHREAALMSASWGRFQIMGFNWDKCGVSSLQEFINMNYKGEEAQLELFVNYIIKVGLDDELRGRKWAAFALQYNGKSYAQNKYDVKLAAAYKKFSK
jgi:hypothetical protein